MSRQRMRSMAAVVLTIAMLVPAGSALARPPESSAGSDARTAHRQADHPTVTLDRVYRGPVDGALGAHVWTGDVFGTGVETTVVYDIGLDADGVPVVTSVVVDESTLPAGVTYTMRGRTSATDDDSTGEPAETNAGTGDAEDPDAGEAEEPVSEITRYSAGAGVRFTMGERWAGLLILLNGALTGGESVAYVRTILVSPPANGRSDETTEATTEDSQPPVREVKSAEDGEATRPDRSVEDRHTDRERARNDQHRRANDRPRSGDRDQRPDRPSRR